MQIDGYIVGRLTAHAQYDAFGSLQLVDGHITVSKVNSSKKKLVGHVVVGGHGLRIKVDHYRLVAERFEFAQARHGTPVELDGRADAVDARAQDHYFIVVVGGVVVSIVACLIDHIRF
jgi:hypothetical protein